MNIIDRGTGTPLVVVPGIQGRWEWMAPAIETLAAEFRVVTFSLCDEPSSGFPSDPSRGVENYLAQLESVYERTGLQNAVLVGVSYGGPIAAEFTVRHPDRVRSLVLVSALPTDWRPDARARFYMRAPRLLSPLFFVDAPLRAQPEIRATFPKLRDRLRFGVQQTARLLRAFMSPTRMATRIHWLQAFSFSNPSAIRQPVLVVTGESGLDRVVPPELTRRYLEAIPHARYAEIPRTGHLGVVTRPAEVLEALRTFLTEISANARRASA